MESETKHIKHTETIEKDEREQDHFSSIFDYFNLILPSGITVIILGAIGYFLGWRYLYAYYVGFGLDALFFTFTPSDVISAGWRIYMLILGIIVVSVFLFNLSRSIIQSILHKKGKLFTYRFYLLFLFLCIGYSIYVILNFYFYGALWYGFYIFSFTCIGLWLVTIAIGDQIQTTTLDKVGQFQPLFVEKFVPSPIILFSIMCIALLLNLSFFSSWNGFSNSGRDRHETSRLQFVTFYMNQQLNIPNGVLIRNGVWKYDDLRFLFKADDIFFAFRTNEVVDEVVTIYAIPRSKVIEFQLRPWYSSNALAP